MSTKRGRAINGDIFHVQHPTLALDVPFTTFIDVTYRGVTHQAFAAADRRAFSYATTTGEFSVAGLTGHIVETLDNVETQASHRYQALVATEQGVLSVHSYDSVDALLSLVGALRPQETALGIMVEPNDEIEFSSPPRVAMQTSIGILDITPLTNQVLDEVPDWQGTSVVGGELFAGRFTDDAAYLTLVTNTCRAMVLPGSASNDDQLATTVAELRVDWQA